MRIGRFQFSARWLWLLLLGPVAAGFGRLSLDVEMLRLLPPELPAVRGLTLYQDYFTNARELVVTLSGAEEEALEAATERVGMALRAAPGLAARVSWRAPWEEAPGEMADLIAYAWLNQPPPVFGELAERLRLPEAKTRLESVKSALSTTFSPEGLAAGAYDPFGLRDLPASVLGTGGSMLGPAQAGAGGERLRLIQVTAAENLPTYAACEAWLGGVKGAVTASLAGAADLQGVRVGYTGRPAFVAEIARGMERDMKRSVLGTGALIALLFWVTQRRLKPLAWLMTLLGLVVAGTLGLGGLLFGEVNVISLGFAAILLGLGVDYALVQYHEAMARPECSVSEIRRGVRRSVLGAAATTVAAFLSLNLCGIPGLAQLGTLVALGVGLAAGVMLAEFLPPLIRGRNDTMKPPATERVSAPGRGGRRLGAGLAVSTVLGLVCAGVLARVGLPGLDPSARPLRPVNSPAYAALEEMQQALGMDHEPLWVVIEGVSEAEVGERLAQVHQALEAGQSAGWVTEFVVPAALWPNAANQRANREVVWQLSQRQSGLEEVAREAGFTDEALGLMRGVFSTWARAGAAEGVYWPESAGSVAVMEKFAARSERHFLALGLVRVAPGKEREAGAQLQAALPPEGAWLTGWGLLGSTVFETVKGRAWLVALTIGGLALISLWLTLRSVTEVALSLGALALSGLCLLTVMRMADWEWNLMNLMAAPLIVGTGIDYGLFMQAGLRRFGGDVRRTFQSTGKAMLLCGGTSIAGFGSLGFSSNAGIASLGPLCALGIGLNLLVALVLLPAWWLRLVRGDGKGGRGTQPGNPSWLYRAGMWGAGVWLTRRLPPRMLNCVAGGLAEVYRVCAPRRQAVVAENLLPAAGGDAGAARAAARELFGNFGRKLIHLWHFEGGAAVGSLLREHSGWEHLEAALAARQGVLLVTVHLGNWELGAAWLAAKGIDLRVITLAEPGEGLTQQRDAARARRGISTLVIGTDPFGSLEVIKRLQEGAAVALLIDRPPARTAVQVRLFGRPFQASVAAAELARASGCAILPVFIVADGPGYQAHILPSVPYDRAELRSREARVALTQEIMRAFEPVIRQHASQWYHFVPIWPVD